MNQNPVVCHFNSKPLELETIREIYLNCYNINTVASLLNCTRQHIHNEISRQLGHQSIKRFIYEGCVK